MQGFGCFCTAASPQPEDGDGIDPNIPVIYEPKFLFRNSRFPD